MRIYLSTIRRFATLNHPLRARAKSPQRCYLIRMDFFWMIPLPNSRRVIPFRLCCHATLWAFNSDRPVFCAFEVLFYQNGGHATTLSQFFHHIKLLYNQSVSVPALLPICRYPEYRVVPESGQRRGLADFGLHTRPPSKNPPSAERKCINP
jgi:hypothetical protein